MNILKLLLSFFIKIFEAAAERAKKKRIEAQRAREDWNDAKKNDSPSSFIDMFRKLR